MSGVTPVWSGSTAPQGAAHLSAERTAPEAPAERPVRLASASGTPAPAGTAPSLRTASRTDRSGELTENYALYGMTKAEAEALQQVFNSQEYRIASSAFVSLEDRDRYFEGIKSKNPAAYRVYTEKYKPNTAQGQIFSSFSVPGTQIRLRMSSADAAMLKRLQAIGYICGDPAFEAVANTFSDRILRKLRETLAGMVSSSLSGSAALRQAFQPGIGADKIEVALMQAVDALYAQYFIDANSTFTEEQLRTITPDLKNKYFRKLESGVYIFKVGRLEEADNNGELKALWERAKAEPAKGQTFDQKLEYLLPRLLAKFNRVLYPNKLDELLKAKNYEDFFKSITDVNYRDAVNKFSPIEAAFVAALIGAVLPKAQCSRAVQNEVFKFELKAYTFCRPEESVPVFQSLCRPEESVPVFQSLLTELFKKEDTDQAKALVAHWLRSRISEMTRQNMDGKTIDEMITFCKAFDVSKLPSSGEVGTLYFYSSSGSVKPPSGGRTADQEIMDVQNVPTLNQKVFAELKRLLTDRALAQIKCVSTDEVEATLTFLNGRTFVVDDTTFVMQQEYINFLRDGVPAYTASTLDPEKVIYSIPGQQGEVSLTDYAVYMAESIFSAASAVLSERADSGSDEKYSAVREKVYAAMAQAVKDEASKSVAQDKLDSLVDMRTDRGILMNLSMSNLYIYYTEGKIDKSTALAKLPWLKDMLSELFDETGDGKLKPKTGMWDVVRRKISENKITNDQANQLGNLIYPEIKDKMAVIWPRISGILAQVVTPDLFDPGKGDFQVQLQRRLDSLQNLSSSEKMFIVQLIISCADTALNSKAVQDAEVARVRYIMMESQEVKDALRILGTATANQEPVGVRIAVMVSNYIANSNNYIDLLTKQREAAAQDSAAGAAATIPQ